MIKSIIAILTTTLFCLPLWGQIMPISSARLVSVGSEVTVRGIATSGAELGKIRYIQDGTGGLAIYPGTGSPSNFEASVFRGDSIEVKGILVLFQGLLEMSPITAFSVISSGNPVPVPKSVSLNQLTNDLESQLISVDCATFSSGSTFNNNSTYTITDLDGNTAKAYTRLGHPLIGQNIPTQPIRLLGILSRYNNFQILPRNAGDLQQAVCFYITRPPVQSSISTSGFKVNWETNTTATAQLLYGTTPNPTQIATATSNITQHNATLSGLIPGTIYWIKTRNIHNTDTIYSAAIPFCTQSLSSGDIKIYFNHTIDNQFVGAKQASAIDGANCLSAMIQRIDNAKQTIDVSVYNNNRTDLANALKTAHARGVRVRYIAAIATQNSALEPPPAFPVIYGNQNYLMHNKFMAIDANLVNDAWVMSGSMNWTTNNIFSDFNNMVMIQDQSLARTYELEFNEMWGSDGAQTDPVNQRFGNQKTDNTPHQFIIGNIPVESYFSPSDKVTNRIVEVLQTANATVEFSLLTFTKNEPGDELVDRFTNWNVQVRGLIENINDVGSEYNFLKSAGIPVGDHYQQYQLHHKYGIIDAMIPSSNPILWTGSHNWTAAAETQNDENSLVFHDSDIARLYKAEFEALWKENPVAVQEPSYHGFNIQPNPAWDSFMITSDQFDLVQDAKIQIWTSTGTFCSEMPFIAGQYIPIGRLSDGSYIVKIKSRNGFAALPLQKISR